MSRQRLNRLAWSALATAAGLATVGAGSASAAPTDPGSPTTRRMSVSSHEAQVQAASFGAVVSGNGRYVAFVSDASKLVPGDTACYRDVFLGDRVNKVTQRVSVSTGEDEANNSSTQPAVSADGRYVAFTSEATNLVGRDSNGLTDVFVRDRVAKTTRLVSVNTDEALADSFSIAPAISPNGRYVAFESGASNLVSGDTNGRADVFVRDRVAKTTTLVSLANDETPGDDSSSAPSISADGQRVAFESYAANLVAGDTNGSRDVFVRDITASTTQRVSVSTSGSQANSESSRPAISADGRYVGFESFASNLVAKDDNSAFDVFVRDLVDDVTSRASIGLRGKEVQPQSFAPSLSAHGRYVAFESRIHVYVRDRVDAVTRTVSVGLNGTKANDKSYEPTVSANGRYVAFASKASNLVTGDTNGMRDVFLRDRGTG